MNHVKSSILFLFLITCSVNCMSKIITKEQLVSEIISNPEVFSAVSSVVQYWDVNNADKRLDLLGAEYKNEIGVRKSMDYRIPGFEFEKIWDGLLFQKIKYIQMKKWIY
jgi:hypothetical protein